MKLTLSLDPAELQELAERFLDIPSKRNPDPAPITDPEILKGTDAEPVRDRKPSTFFCVHQVPPEGARPGARTLCEAYFPEFNGTPIPILPHHRIAQPEVFTFESSPRCVACLYAIKNKKADRDQEPTPSGTVDIRQRIAHLLAVHGKFAECGASAPFSRVLTPELFGPETGPRCIMCSDAYRDRFDAPPTT